MTMHARQQSGLINLEGELGLFFYFLFPYRCTPWPSYVYPIGMSSSMLDAECSATQGV